MIKKQCSKCKKLILVDKHKNGYFLEDCGYCGTTLKSLVKAEVKKKLGVK